MSTTDSLRDFANRIAVIILLVALALGVWHLRNALMLVFFTVIIAVALSRPVEILKNRGWSHGLSVLTVVASVISILVIISLIILPALVRQVGDLIDRLPDAWVDAQNEYNALADDYDYLPELEAGRIGDEDIRDTLLSGLGSASSSVLPFLGNIGGALTNLLIVFVLSLYLLSDPKIYVEGILTLTPRDYRPRAYEVMRELKKAIQLAVGSQVLAMFVVGFMTFVGLTVIGVDNALALAVVSGLLNFIPTFGAIFALIIALIFTLATNPDKIVFVIIWYLGLQQLESNVITPQVVKNALNLPGAVIIITQIVAGILFGFLGILLAVPIVAVIMVLVREMYVYDLLNSRKAEIIPVALSDGTTHREVTADLYRPPELSPGETASLLASGADPFQHVEQNQTIEIIGASVEQMNRVTRDQQAVWVAILALIAAQGLALIRSLLTDSKSSIE